MKSWARRREWIRAESATATPHRRKEKQRWVVHAREKGKALGGAVSSARRSSQLSIVRAGRPAGRSHRLVRPWRASGRSGQP